MFRSIEIIPKVITHRGTVSKVPVFSKTIEFVLDISFLASRPIYTMKQIQIGCQHYNLDMQRSARAARRLKDGLGQELDKTLLKQWRLQKL